MLKYHFLLVSAALLFQIPVANAQIFEAVVVSVGDGDTIRVKSNTKNLTVRLGCIDAPEKKQNPWGVLATKRLKQLLRVGSKISLRSIGTDRYKRLVAEVYVNNRSINTNLVQEGHAVVYRQYLSGCSPKLQNSLLNAEAYAKKRNLGFWKQANPIMPWDFRRHRKPVARKPQIQTQQKCDSS